MKFEISKKMNEALLDAIKASYPNFSQEMSNQLFEQLKSLLEKARESETDAVRDLEIYVNEINTILKEASDD